MAPLEPSSTKRNILVTGFGPFEDYAENPSWMAVKTFEGRQFTVETNKLGNRLNNPTTYTTHTQLVKVAYEEVLSLAPDFHKDDRRFSHIIHVGVGSKGAIAVERRAPRHQYNAADVDGRHLNGNSFDAIRGYDLQQDLHLDPLKHFEYQYGIVDVDDVVAKIRSTKMEGIDLEHVRTSDDPGSYLCGFIYYTSMSEARKKAWSLSDGKDAKTPGDLTPVLFVHVPPLHKPYTQEQLAIAVWEIVRYVVETT